METTHIWNMQFKINRVGMCEQDASGSGYGPIAGSCEHDNELTGSTTCCKILE
jgi:hypothetical protein